MRKQALAAARVTNGEDADVPVAGKIRPASYIVYGKVLYYGADKHVIKFEGLAGTLIR